MGDFGGDEWSVHSASGVHAPGAGQSENDPAQHNSSRAHAYGKDQQWQPHTHGGGPHPMAGVPPDAELAFARKVRELEDSFRARYESMRGVYEGRLASMAGQLRATYRDLETDEVVCSPIAAALLRAALSSAQQEYPLAYPFAMRAFPLNDGGRQVLQAMVDDPASAGFVQHRMGEMVRRGRATQTGPHTRSYTLEN